MLRRFSVGLLFLLDISNAQTVTAVRLAEAGHSTVQYLWQSSNIGSVTNLRTRVVPTSSRNVCTDGTSGWAQLNSWQNAASSFYIQEGPHVGWEYGQIGGLDPNTQYTICPEVSGNNGSTWTRGGPSITVTTATLRDPHPAMPIPPTDWDSSPPDTTRYTVISYTSKAQAGANLCSDIGRAYTNLAAHGTVIKIPSNGTDQDPVVLKCNVDSFVSAQPADVHQMTTAADPATSQLTLASHGLTEGGGIQFTAKQFGGGCLPNSQFSPGDCKISPGNWSYGSYGIVPGEIYYVHVVDANHVQIYANAPMNQNGTLVTYNSSVGQNPKGTCSASSPCLWTPWPRTALNGHRIVICTAASTCSSAPETKFIPIGTRIQGPSGPPRTVTAPVDWQPTSPATWWASQMASISANDNFNPNAGNIHTIAAAMDWSSFISGLYFIGIHWVLGPDPEDDYNLTAWPMPHQQWIWTNPLTDNWTFDRNWFETGSTKTLRKKTSRQFLWNGKNMSIQNSYLEGMHYAHSATSNGGLGGTPSAPPYEGFNVAGTRSTRYSIGEKGDKYCGGGGQTCVGPLSSAVTISVNGTNGATAQNDFAYFTMDGTLNIALPPGLTGTCSGYTPCRVYGLRSDMPSNVYDASGSNRFPNTTNGTNAIYAVDPVFTSDGTKNNKKSLWINQTDHNMAAIPDSFSACGVNSGPGALVIGNRFYSDQSGYMIGVRVFKFPGDKRATHTVDLWSDTGAKLGEATTSNETRSGWQEADFGAPVAITAGFLYRASSFVDVGANCGYIVNYTRNHEVYSSPLHMPGFYVASNGNHNVNDNWPTDYKGMPAVLINSGVVWQNGTIQSGWRANIFDDVGYPFGEASTEGCQCAVNSLGPGPYKFYNNYLEASGNTWHYDDGGGHSVHKQGFIHQRNYALIPAWAMAGNPENLGVDYQTRHLWEWKSGDRGNFSGNVVGGSLQSSTPLGDLVEWSGTSGFGVRDWNVHDNIWAHGGLGFSGPYMYPTNSFQVPYITRTRFANNLIWDIAGSYCAQGYTGFCPRGAQAGGVIFDMNDSDEDRVIDHNTIVYNNGSQPTFLSIRSGQMELFVTNNILNINAAQGGDGIRWADAPSRSVSHAKALCGTLSGPAKFACISPNGKWLNNVLTSDGYSQSQLKSLWPNKFGTLSYKPSSPTNGSSVGWFNFISSTSQSNNYRLKTNWCSGCGFPATDGKDVGVDMDRIEAAIGYVSLGDVTSVTSNAANVSFNDYAKNSCAVLDYSTDPNFGTFTRVNLTASGKIPNSVNLSGLAASTLYRFRVLCQSMALSGQFKTQP